MLCSVWLTKSLPGIAPDSVSTAVTMPFPVTAWNVWPADRAVAAIANMISQQRKESLQQQEELRQKYLQQLVELRQQGDADPGLALAIWSQILSRANRPPIL